MHSFPQRVGNLLKRSKTRPLSPLERLIPNSGLLTLSPITVVPSLEAFIVSPASSAYEESRILQAERYARASRPGQSSYLETVDFAPEHTIPLVIRRRETGQMVGTARLELPGASIVEAVVQFQSDSALAHIVARGAFAEVGGFATPLDLEWSEKLDVIDTISAVITQLADKIGVERFFLFPRRTLMGLLLAAIPDILPPYRFTLAQEVLGWQEGNPRLQGVRQLHVKALPASPDDLPVVYAIEPGTWSEDVQSRLAVQGRRQQVPELARHLMSAMRQAQRQIDIELARLNQKRREVGTDTAVPASPAITSGEPKGRQGFLPFPATADFKAQYLEQVMTQGGETVRQYKTMSYDLLELGSGMQVLDVGCGAGADLLVLAEQVGQAGLVVGLDNDHDVLQAARKTIAGRSNVLLVASVAEKLPFLDGVFDRVHADRLLQHVAQPAQVLSEMLRVLKPGGVLALVEPDWKAIALYPGSPAGGEDDATLESVLKRYQSKLSHALIGRQLYGLLRQQGATAWEQIQVQAVSFTLTAWPVVDTLLQLAESARNLAHEQSALKKDIQAWLQALDEAHRAGTFLASIPMFFAQAHKAPLAATAD